MFRKNYNLARASLFNCLEGVSRNLTGRLYKPISTSTLETKYCQIEEKTSYLSVEESAILSCHPASPVNSS